MSIVFTDVSIRGRKKRLPSVKVAGSHIVVNGRFLKIAEIFDEYWLESDSLPDLPTVLARCRTMTPRPDVYTFRQRVPDTEPRFEFAKASENVAVIPLSSYDEWFTKQISPAARRNIKSATRKGVSVRVSDYDDAYVRGIMAIYDETPIRQGRRFWHYRKSFDAVKAENGTYADRSMFLAAYLDDEMIGYLKLVWDGRNALMMNVLSHIRHYDKRPNNALLAEAVRQCCARGAQYLLYESFVYGKKDDNSLTDFKRNNGFVRMDLPRYFVPLTRTGAAAVRLGLHRSHKDKLPAWVNAIWVDLRSRWYRLALRWKTGPELKNTGLTDRA